jgi:hypothetical protein
MRNIKIFLLVLIFTTSCNLGKGNCCKQNKEDITSTRQALKIILTFGAYFDNHAKRKFEANERKWELNGKILKYSIDTHGTRYGEPLELADKELGTIIRFIQDRKLVQPVNKKLETEFLNKHEYAEVIKGSITLNDKIVKILIIANGYGLTEKDITSKHFMELEQIFYKIVDSHR